MEIGGLHYKMTLHTLCLRINELLHTICLSLSSHYGFKSSRGRKQVPERKEFPAEEGNRKELFIRFTASAFPKLPSIYVFSYFPFGFEGRMWDLIVSVPDHCLSFYFVNENRLHKGTIPLLVLNPFRNTLPSSEWLLLRSVLNILSQQLAS